MINQKPLTIEMATELPELKRDEALAACVFTGEPSLSGARGTVLEAVENLMRDGEFTGKAEDSLLLHLFDGQPGAPYGLLLLGCGQYGEDDPPLISRTAGAAVRRAREARIKRLSFMLPVCRDARRLTRAVTEGALLGLLDLDVYQNHEEEPPALEHLTIIAPAGQAAQLKREVERARVIADAVNWTRLLSNEPGAILPPRELARRAAEMAAEFGLKVESLNAEEIRARGMGALLGVGQGSVEEPVLIVVRYEPEGASEADELWAFVGKGITFDTGGISIKHGLDMYEMKADMAGGAAVLGAMRAIAQLKPQRRIAGIVPAAENMPSGSAIKPGDIVRTLAGYTIEVVDTDAEGRLVLADGIAYAKQLGAKRIVDLATLTGSIVVALGDYRTGLFSNDDEWANAVLEAAARAGEPAWRMPVSDDYKKRIESDIADFKNYSGRPDATAAALLLGKFAGTTPWAHLDIAGTSWYDDPQPHAPKGPTGTGVRTLVELACAQDFKS
jgi:leucyl aminopeptidase